MLVLMDADQCSTVLQNVLHGEGLEAGDRPDRIVALTREDIQRLEQFIRERLSGLDKDAVESILTHQAPHFSVILQGNRPSLARLDKTTAGSRGPVEPSILEVCGKIRQLAFFFEAPETLARKDGANQSTNVDL
jgi:hypothetical protein